MRCPQCGAEAEYGLLMTKRQLAKTLTGRQNFDAIDRVIRNNGIKPKGKRGKYDAYDLREVAPALWDDRDGMASSDVRNLAQARKNDVETEIMLGRFRPVEEHVGFAADLVDIYNSLLGNPGISAELRDDLIDQFDAALDSYQSRISGESARPQSQAA